MKKPTRVIVFAPHFAEYSTRLAQAMASDAKVLLILCRADREARLEPQWFRTASANLEVFEFRDSRRIWLAPYSVAIFARCILFRPDILHVQEQADSVTSRITRWMRRFCKVVLTIHDPKPHSGGDTDFMLTKGKLRQDQIRAAADLFHLHGQVCSREFAAIDSSRPIVDAPHGVIHCPEPDQVRAPEPGRVIFFGRMEAYKGLSVLLDAAEILQAENLACTVVLAGRGADLDEHRRRASALANVEILDRFLSPREVVDEFQKAAIAVLPYLDATQSGVAAAAIGNGRPIVASATGGLVDVVRDGREGLLVPPGDARALADALARVIQDDALRARLTAGAMEAQTRLSWAAIASTLYGAYQEIPERKAVNVASA